IWVYADDGSETVFEATPFIKDQYGNFKSAEKIYWPDGKENLNFTAFWPSPERLNTDADREYCQSLSGYNNDSHQKLTLTPNTKLVTFENSRNAFYHYDFISATQYVSKNQSNKGITLNFKHALAQIEFRAKIDKGAEHRVEISSIVLCNINRSSNYSITENNWNITANNRRDVFSAPLNKLTLTEEYASLTTKTGPIFLAPQNLVFEDYSKTENTKGTILYVYGQVYKNDNLIFPTLDWTDEEKNHRIMKPDKMDNINQLINPNNLELGILRIQLGTTPLELEAGHKYIFTIDFTNGVGFYGKSDPTYPGEPIINHSLSAKVDIEEWAENNQQADA
ncbi:MAG: fimbrillin family protein, partial [Muribaculaceae bacterium]|nr:fimbrillin family protein [Muribaculaceae bacterium]